MPRGETQGCAPLASKTCLRRVSLFCLDSRSSEGLAAAGYLDAWDPAFFSCSSAWVSGPAKPVRPSWPPTSPGRKEFNGGQVLELWAGSSCEPKAGNSPQEPSSHKPASLKEFAHCTPLLERQGRRTWEGERNWGGGRRRHGLPLTSAPSPIPAGASCWQFPQSFQALSQPWVCGAPSC